VQVRQRPRYIIAQLLESEPSRTSSASSADGDALQRRAVVRRGAVTARTSVVAFAYSDVGARCLASLYAAEVALRW